MLQRISIEKEIIFALKEFFKDKPDPKTKLEEE